MNPTSDNGSSKCKGRAPENAASSGRAGAATLPEALPAAERGVRLRFLGSGDNFGSGGRFQTCIHVDTGRSRFLIDCGASSLIPMKRAGIGSDAIDAILITHLHGDHFGGIPFFILDAQLISRREAPLVIAGPPGLAQRVREAMEVFYPGSSGVERRFSIEYVEMTDAEDRRIGDLTVLPVRVVHGSGAPSYALRIACAGKIIAYSGDTEWTDVLLQVADGADLFVCESYGFAAPLKNHLSYRTLMAHRAEFRCRRMIITHMGEETLKHLGEIALEAAEDGKEVVL